MKIRNKLIVAVSFVSSVVIIQIIIIKKLISKYKVINQLNYDFIDIRDDMLEVVRMMKEFINNRAEKEEENKDDTGNC